MSAKVVYDKNKAYFWTVFFIATLIKVESA